MNLELPSGAAIPLLVAAVAAAALYWFLGRKPPGPGASITSWSIGNPAGLFSGGKIAWVSLLVAVWSHRAAVLDVLRAAAEKLKPILFPSATPTDQPKEEPK